MTILQANRPTGVTILGILAIISGIIMLIAGAVLALLSAIIPSLSSLDPEAAQELQSQLQSSNIPVELLGPLFNALAGLMIALGIASIVVAFGLFKGKGWAWTVTTILSFINIATDIISIVFGNFAAIAGLVINGIVLYYLFRPHVKAYFGKAKPPAA